MKGAKLVKLFLECIPCYQKQALFATRNLDHKFRAKVLRKLMSYLCSISWEITPDEIANRVYNLIRDETGIVDPYKEIKTISNKTALKLYPNIKAKLGKTQKERRLYLAANLAIAGNIIDYGPAFDFDLEETIEEVLNKEPAINDFDILLEKVMSAQSLLYFADNAGEIVFDKMFIEEMIAARGKPFKTIAFVVKGGPIINDAMIEDVYEVGIDEIPNVVFHEIGNGEKGTGPDRGDEIVKEWIKRHDLVISKGQGNFEGLSENGGIFFMLLAKCPVIAKEIGVNVKDTIIKYQVREENK